MDTMEKIIQENALDIMNGIVMITYHMSTRGKLKNRMEAQNFVTV